MHQHLMKEHELFMAEIMPPHRRPSRQTWKARNLPKEVVAGNPGRGEAGTDSSPASVIARSHPPLPFFPMKFRSKPATMPMPMTGADTLVDGYAGLPPLSVLVGKPPRAQ
jgi:hypothetical protein